MNNTENTVSETQSGYDAKLQRAEALVSEFNKVQPQVPENELIPRIKSLGGITEESLTFFKEEDLIEAIPSLTKVLARQIIAIFQEKPKAEDPKPTHVSGKQADRMRFEQLLGFYDPEAANAVSRKLSELGKGLPFIVFLPKGGVDVQTSTSLLKEIRAGFKARPNNLIEVDGSYQKIYKVGENPDILFDENPLYPGRPLRPDGTCDQLNRSWHGVETKIRQFLWIGVHDTKEIQVTIDKAHEILDKALQGDRLLNLQRRYQKTAHRFQELAEENKLPNLKIKGGKAAQIRQNNDPFFAGCEGIVRNCKEAGLLAMDQVS